MKKFLSLILVLALALSLAAPALAFTGDAPDDDADVIFDLTIELVDFEDTDNSFSAYQAFSAPASNRGYAMNEIVCAIVSIAGPKNASLYNEGYRSLKFEGDGVTLKVAEVVYSNIKVNEKGLDAVKGNGSAAAGAVKQPSGTDKDEIKIAFTNTSFSAIDKAYTLAWAFFAKVTGDDALLSASLSKGLIFSTTTHELEISDDYVVTESGTAGTNQIFTVEDADGVDLFQITTGKNNASKALEIWLPDTVNGVDTAGWFTVSREASTGDLIFSATSIGLVDLDGTLTTNILYSANHTGNNSTNANVKRAYNYLMSIYDNDFVDYFGMDYDNIGNKVDEEFFEDIVAADDLYAEVEIAPWFAYVEVPPEIVVDPPKTGDVVSVLGFILIALAAAAVVVVKKVRA